MQPLTVAQGFLQPGLGKSCLCTLQGSRVLTLGAGAGPGQLAVLRGLLCRAAAARAGL